MLSGVALLRALVAARIRTRVSSMLSLALDLFLPYMHQSSQLLKHLARAPSNGPALGSPISREQGPSVEKDPSGLSSLPLPSP